jgi:hypothetical protein
VKHVLALVAALAALGAFEAGAGQRAPVLAVANGTLLRVDPVTLRAADAERLRLSERARFAVRSPDGRQLALSGPGPAQLTIVELAGLRRLVTVDLPGTGNEAAIAWPAPQRIVFVRHTVRRRPGPLERAVVTVVDPVAGTVVSHRPLRWALVDARSAPSGVVLLLQPRSGLGEARLGVVDASGRVRSVALPRVRAGETTRRSAGGWRIVRADRPGLAVRDDADRAYVVGRDAAAEVDLRTLRVRSCELNLRRPAKGGLPVQGSSRSAHWLGRGRLAFWGSDVDAKQEHPTGPLVLEVNAWSLRAVDAPANALFRGVGDLILAFGSIGDRGPRPDDVLGVTAYDAAGRVRLQVLPRERAFVVATAGRYAYVYRRTARAAKLRSVVDLRTGSVVHTEEHVWRIPDLLF